MGLTLNLDKDILHLDYQVVQEKPFEAINNRIESFYNKEENFLSFLKCIDWILKMLYIIDGKRYNFCYEKDFINHQQWAKTEEESTFQFHQNKHKNWWVHEKREVAKNDKN